MIEWEGTVSPADAPETVAIIGLGLMGGSLARDLSALGRRVLVADARPEVAAAALRERVASEVLDPELAGVAGADLVVIATPVDSAVAVLRQVAPLVGPHATITDVGSTKVSICLQAEAAGVADRFAGSHPMAGDHRSGWGASRLDLFRDAPVFLCPTSSTGSPTLHRLRAFWTGLGARTEVLNPEEHDRRIAWASHLPQAVSSALAQTFAAAGIDHGDLGPGGRDMLRLAASDPGMWTAISLDNAIFIGESIDGLMHHLSRFRDALRPGDREAITSFFLSASQWHSSTTDPS